MKKFLFAAAAFVAAMPASAATIDPYNQLTGPTPTVGNFVFGTVNPGTGAITPLTPVQQNCDGNPSVTCARGLGTIIPVVYASTTPSFDGATSIPTDRVLLHPSNAAFAGLAFFAALSGTYNFAGEFSIQQLGATGVDVGAVSSTGLSLLPSQALFSGARSFDFTTTLAAGQGVSFFVGPNSSDNSDNTGLLLRVSDVVGIAGAAPEPATWLMMILGFGIVGGTLRSRRRVSARLAAA